MIYQDTNFKICLSLFGWKENILPKVHIVHCRWPWFGGRATTRRALSPTRSSRSLSEKSQEHFKRLLVKIFSISFHKFNHFRVLLRPQMHCIAACSVVCEKCFSSQSSCLSEQHYHNQPSMSMLYVHHHLHLKTFCSFS